MRPIFLALLCVAAPALGAPPVRVLLLSGQNNHDWKSTTPALQKILADSGRFAVDVTERPDQCTAETLAKYDVVLSNWNTFSPQGGVTNWPAETRAAFLDFVRGGKGHVVVHAGSSSFNDWPEYQQICGAWWANGQTGHGAPHAFTVKPAGDHPVTRGLAPFQTTDELWLKPGVHPGARVLATADEQPVALATSFGKGRGFTVLLGHDAGRMSNTGFQALLLRGTEWAATGKATIDLAEALLKTVASYQYGQSRAALLETARMAQASPREMAPKLAALLGSGATLEAKKFACEQLALVGTDTEVPALEKLLKNPELALAARSAIERIPGEASLAALRNALASADGAMRQGIALALGARHDNKAVPALATLAPDTAAIDALGLIGTQEALAALMAAESSLPADARPRWAAAALKCATAQQDLKALEKLCDPAQPSAIRTAAFVGRVSALGDRGADTLLAALTGGDATLQAAAIRALRESKSSALLRAAAERLDRLPPDARAPLIVILGERGDAAALAGILAEVSSPDEPVRRAALDAIGSLGNASAVPVLVGLIEKGDETDRKAAADALGRLRGADIDAALVSALRKSPPGTQAVLIRALTERDAKSALPAMLEAAASSEADVRQEAIRALNKMAGADAGPRVIALLDRAADADRSGIETALVAVYRRANAVKPLAEAARAATGAKKSSLLAVLGALGGPESLNALRTALKDGDADVRTAAVRALAAWPDAAPAGDLVAAAEATADLKIKALALRGVARMVPPAQDLDRKQKKDLLQRGIGASGREEETALLKTALALVSSSNLALGATATNLDGLAPDHDGRGPEAAIDGNPATYWDETDGQKLYWLKVQLKRPATISALRITGFKHHEYVPKDFEVLCDGKVVKTVTGAQYVENVLAVDLPATRCAAVELKITGVYGASPAIRELEILGEEE
jgi:uncharacterized protein